MTTIKNNSIVVTKATLAPEEFIQKKIDLFKDDDEPFFAVDLEDVCNKHIRWITLMPRITPHYAVKCNNDTNVIKLLAYLGAGFDCASKEEIQKIMDLGVSTDRIIYANPCKQPAFVRYAQEAGVRMMTFDNEEELLKIRQLSPDAKLVLRIVTDDSNAVTRFSMKFGADMDTSRKLIDKALEIDMEVIGVSFHCGSGQMTSIAFVDAITNAREIMDYGNKLGYHMNLLDIGGGFPGDIGTEDYFAEIADAVNEVLEKLFPEDGKIRIIAEPGRYYVASAFTLATSVIASRETVDAETKARKQMYYINDGVYGSFNCVFYDFHVPKPHLFPKNQSDEKFTTSIWGPTCDGLDCVLASTELPKLRIGDWLYWKDMGAYTISGSVKFNGLPFGKPIYYISRQLWATLKPAFLSVPRRCQVNPAFLRLVSNDCAYEVEDDMLPWLPEDFAEDVGIVTIN